MFGSLRKSCVLAGRNLLPELVKCPDKLTGVSAKNPAFQLNRISSGCQHFFHTTIQTDQKTSSKPLEAPLYELTKDDKRIFESTFHEIVKDLTQRAGNYEIPETNQQFATALYYNIPGGKNNRSMTFYNSYRMLIPESELTPETKQLALTMAWCIELLQAFVMVLDDIMYEADERRGKKCWYHIDNLGKFAINDGILFECATYETLRHHFRDKPYYNDVVELFHVTAYKRLVGESLDLIACKFGKPNLTKFTKKFYTAMVKRKASFCNWYFPVAVAMHMSGIKNQDLFSQAENILLDMGCLFQVQDDFLDLYGSDESAGKKGTDIQAGKCSWLAVTALEKADPAQREIMTESYGSSDPRKVEAVRKLYDTLDLRSAYAKYQEEAYKNIKSSIQQISGDLPPEMFLAILEKFYKK